MGPVITKTNANKCGMLVLGAIETNCHRVELSWSRASNLLGS